MSRRTSLMLVIAAGVVVAALLWSMRPGERTTGPLSQEVYVWQRTWDGPVLASIQEHAPHFAAVVALAAEVTWTDGQATTIRTGLDYEVLRSGGSPIGLALRIGPFPGPFSGQDTRALFLADLALALVTEAASNQVNAVELQIDFDCATSKLDGYRLWLEAIRTRVAPVPVVVTVLPSWLKSPALRRLMETADGYVLQVHSLERPRTVHAQFTLCDPRAARAAAERAGRLGRPFRVALPTYGYLLAFDSKGSFLGLSAEGPPPSWPEGTQIREVRADAEALAALVRDWTRDRPASMRGVIWYRLPVDDDVLNWRWPTLQSVMQGTRPEARCIATARRVSAGLVEIELGNHGSADHIGPVQLVVRWQEARLVAGDALLEFELMEPSRNTVEFDHIAQPLRLGAGEVRTVGWLRLDRDVEVTVERR